MEKLSKMINDIIQNGGLRYKKKTRIQKLPTKQKNKQQPTKSPTKKNTHDADLLCYETHVIFFTQYQKSTKTKNHKNLFQKLKPKITSPPTAFSF